jgi:hypothetical protein
MTRERSVCGIVHNNNNTFLFHVRCNVSSVHLIHGVLLDFLYQSENAPAHTRAPPFAMRLYHYWRADCMRQKPFRECKTALLRLVIKKAIFGRQCA